MTEQNIQRELGDMHARIKNIEGDMSEVKKCIVGENGRNGLVGDVNKAKGAISTMRLIGGIGFGILTLAVTFLSVKGCA